MLLVLLASALFAFAQGKPPGPTVRPELDANSLPEQVKDIGIDQKLDADLPLDAVFTDDTGVTKPLREFLSDRPAVLAPVYYECPMLCHMILNGVLRTVRATPLTVGKDFDIIAFSFDPTEGPQNSHRKKFEYTERYRRPGSEHGWVFLTGDEANIKRLTSAIGYRYKKDPNSAQWIHASGIVVVTPQGKISKYFYGVEYSARDLRFGLVEASANRIGTLVDQMLMYCFHYDPSMGKYSLTVLRIMRVTAAATVLALALFWFISWRQKKTHNVERLPAIS